MKRISLLFVIIMLCSFVGKRKNNSLAESQLKGKVKRVTEYIYSKTFRKDILENKTILQYDENGNIISQRSYDAYDSINSPTIIRDYKYNEDFNKTESNIYNSDGRIIEKRIFTYDNNGNPIESKEYHDSGVIEEDKFFKYDTNGNMVEETSYNSKSELNDKSILKYDKDNNLTEAVAKYYMPRPATELRLNNKYDNKGILIESIYVQHNENKPEQDYHDNKYFDTIVDKAGNSTKYIEVILFMEGHDTTIHQREITYY